MISYKTLGSKFWLYFYIMFSSAFVDNVLKNAMIVYVLFNKNEVLGLPSESLAPVAAGIFILPFLIFSSLAGQWSDGTDKRRIILICKITELLIGVTVLIYFPRENFVVLLLALFALGLHSTFFGPAKYSVIKELVMGDHLILATAWVEAGTFIAILLGTVGGSFLAGGRFLENYAVGALMIACSTVALICSLFLPKFNFKKIVLQKYNPWRNSSALIRELNNHVELKTVVHAISWFYFMATFFVTMLPAIVKNDFQKSPDVVPWIYGVFIVGIAAGSLVYEKFSKAEINLRPMFISTVAIFFTLLGLGILLPSSQHYFVFVLCIVLMLSFAIFSGVFSTPLYSQLQLLPNTDWKSQAVAGNNILNSLYMIAASIIQLGFYALGFSHSTMIYFLAFSWCLVMILLWRQYAYLFAKTVLSIVLPLRYKVTTRGKENISPEGPAIIISNHVSFIDWALIFQLSKRPMRFVVWYLYYNFPLLKSSFVQIGAIAIAGRKENMECFQQSFMSINHALKDGQLVLYFPEGNITKNGEMDFFRRGIQDIVANYGESLTIIPIHINGMWRSITSKNPKSIRTLPLRLWRRRHVNINIGEGFRVNSSELDLKALELRVLNLKAD